MQETGKGFYRLDDAVKSVNGGDAAILIAPGTYRDCAIQSGGRITFKAADARHGDLRRRRVRGQGDAGAARPTTRWSTGWRSRTSTSATATARASAPSTGDLTVMNATFRDCRGGHPLAAIPNDEPHRSLDLLGAGQLRRSPDCAHGLYIGHYGKLYVTRSRFDRGRGGHYLKAPRAGGVDHRQQLRQFAGPRQSNYIIDLPSGATGLIARNVMLNGPDKENHSGFIVVAAEQRDNPSAGLTITGNTATMAPGATITTPS